MKTLFLSHEEDLFTGSEGEENIDSYSWFLGILRLVLRQEKHGKYSSHKLRLSVNLSK
jgi:hypothetical protein